MARGIRMLEIITTELIAVGTAVASGGAAWGAAKVALNGTRERVKEVVMIQEHHARTQQELLQRAAALEAKIDLVLDRMKT